MSLQTPSLLADCVRVVNQAFLGMLTTVDAHGHPCARWMGTAVAANGLNTIYTFTSKTSRKIEHIRLHPQVSWVFTTSEYTDVVTLTGQARIDASPIAKQQIWDRMMDCARVWCMNTLGQQDNLEMVVLETHIQTIELLSPRLKIYTPQSVPLPQRD